MLSCCVHNDFVWSIKGCLMFFDWTCFRILYGQWLLCSVVTIEYCLDYYYSGTIKVFKLVFYFLCWGIQTYLRGDMIFVLMHLLTPFFGRKCSWCSSSSAEVVVLVVILAFQFSWCTLVNVDKINVCLIKLGLCSCASGVNTRQPLLPRRQSDSRPADGESRRFVFYV